jgi:hypothetical protein
MDAFTQRALAVSQGPGWQLELDIDSATPAEKGPLTIEDRLALAYNGAIAQYFSWRFTNMRSIAFDGSVSLSRETKSIIEQAESRESALGQQIPTVRQRLAGLMARLPGLRAEYADLCRQLETDPPLDASPFDVGQIAIAKAGCERLIPAIERAIERLRADLARLKKERENWGVLANLAGVIAGTRRPSDGLAHDLGLQFDWQICDPYARAKREEEYKEKLELERRRAAEWEAGREERERRAAELAEAAAAKQAEEERFKALGFEDLLSFLFFEEQHLTLNEIKRQVAGWNHHHTLKAVVDLWPERPEPNLWWTAHNEINEIAAGRDKYFCRAADRLAQILHPGYHGDAALPSQAAQDLHEAGNQPTYDEVHSMDFNSLIGFIFAGKPEALDSMPTLRAVIAARPDRPASNTVHAAINELLPIGATESGVYNYALQRLATLIAPQEETQSL